MPNKMDKELKRKVWSVFKSFNIEREKRIPDRAE